jgi:hypothetical protein
MMIHHYDTMPDHYYTIGIYLGFLLVVDSDAVARGEKYYLYWFELHKFHKINVRFDRLFDHWIVAQGEPYWSWSMYD